MFLFSLRRIPNKFDTKPPVKQDVFQRIGSQSVRFLKFLPKLCACLKPGGLPHASSSYGKRFTVYLLVIIWRNALSESSHQAVLGTMGMVVNGFNKAIFMRLIEASRCVPTESCSKFESFLLQHRDSLSF